MLDTCAADGCHKGQWHEVEKLVRPVMMHLRLWLVVCAWCLTGWTTPAQASWEAYQRAGETAYSRGRYGEAERMFLAAVREARRFGPQDSRLDISLHKLALLRVIRSQQTHTQFRSQRTAKKKTPARQRRVSRRGHQRQQPRTALQHGKPGRYKQALLSGRPGARRKDTRISISRSERRSKRPRAALHRARPIHRAVPAMRHQRRQTSVRRGSFRRVSYLRRGHQVQRSHITIRPVEPQHPGRRARHSNKRRAARLPRRVMLHTGQPHIALLWLQQGATT